MTSPYEAYVEMQKEARRFVAPHLNAKLRARTPNPAAAQQVQLQAGMQNMRQNGVNLGGAAPAGPTIAGVGKATSEVDPGMGFKAKRFAGKALPYVAGAAAVGAVGYGAHRMMSGDQEQKAASLSVEEQGRAAARAMFGQ